MTRFDLKSKIFCYEVSTVELPEGYSQSELGSYETMIMGYKGEWLDFQERSNTIEQALADHIKALAFCVKQYNMEMKIK
jgi:hypothetical protein